jgi:hypothetical protein
VHPAVRCRPPPRDVRRALERAPRLGERLCCVRIDPAWPSSQSPPPWLRWPRLPQPALRSAGSAERHAGPASSSLQRESFGFFDSRQSGGRATQAFLRSRTAQLSGHQSAALKRLGASLGPRALIPIDPLTRTPARSRGWTASSPAAAARLPGRSRCATSAATVPPWADDQRPEGTTPAQDLPRHRGCPAPVLPPAARRHPGVRQLPQDQRGQERPHHHRARATVASVSGARSAARLSATRLAPPRCVTCTPPSGRSVPRRPRVQRASRSSRVATVQDSCGSRPSTA